MESTPLRSFGDLLKTWRQRQHLEQHPLAAQLGVHRNTLSHWERGRCLPESTSLILELAYHLRLTAPETRQLLNASRIALAPLRRALAQREQALGQDHPAVAAGLHTLAVLYHAQGQPQEALPLVQRARAIWEQALGPEHATVATCRQFEADLQDALHRTP